MVDALFFKLNGIDEIIKNGENYDLSGTDILRITDNKTNIYKYEDLENVQYLDEIFNLYGAAIILYQTAEKYGHWVSLIKKSNKLLEFYDPYGINVDDELNIDNNYHLRIHGGKLVPHLTSLIEKGGWRVEVNKTQIQKIKEDVNTCGRYCALRVRFKNLSMLKFNNLFLNNKCYDSDFWASALTILC